MRLSIKTYLFLSLFSILLLIYILLPRLYPQNPFIQEQLFRHLDVFDNPAANFIFAIISFLLSAAGITLLCDFVYTDIAGNISRHPKLGKCLLAEDLITENELKFALEEQKLRIGEILVKANRITPLQLKDALKKQKKSDLRMGEVLLALGYAEKNDILWALEKIDRRLGDILKDNHIISEYDLQCVLSMQRGAFLE